MALSDNPLTARGQTLPPGTACGNLANLNMHVTLDFIHRIACHSDASGRYVQMQKNVGDLLTITELEVYIRTTGRCTKC